MVINFNVYIKDLHNNDLIISNNNEQPNKIKLDDAIVYALTNEEIKDEGERKHQNWKLAKRIVDDPECDVTLEELVIIKMVLASQYKGVVSGWAWEYIINQIG